MLSCTLMNNTTENLSPSQTRSRTDKPIKLKRILAFEAAEEAKDREVAEVRLKHINLMYQLNQLEDQVKEKEELAEGLHLIGITHTHIMYLL